MGWFSLISWGLTNPRQYLCSGVVWDGRVGFLTCVTLGLLEDISEKMR